MVRRLTLNQSMRVRFLLSQLAGLKPALQVLFVAVAQPEERLIVAQEVVGSIPAGHS